jgi:hypothetical protein
MARDCNQPLFDDVAKPFAQTPDFLGFHRVDSFAPSA